MQIYLAKPGGPRQGPYTVEQINADLAARKYRDDDFWAWHYGLPQWVPLYSVGGISGAADTTFFFCGLAPANSDLRTRPPEPPGTDTAIFLAKPPWLDVLQQSAEINALRIPAAPEVDTVVLLEPTSASNESQPLREEQNEVIAASVAPTPVAEAPAPGLNAATEATGDQFAQTDSPAPAAEAPQEETPVLLDPQTAPGESQPVCEAQTAEVAVCAAPTPAADDSPAELGAPAAVALALATPVEPTPVEAETAEPIVVRAVKAKPSKRRAAGRRRLFLLEGQATRQAGGSTKPAKMTRRAFASRKRRKPLNGEGAALQPAWN